MGGFPPSQRISSSIHPESAALLLMLLPIHFGCHGRCPNAFPRVPLPFGGLFCPAGPDPGRTGALCSDALVCLEARCEQTAAAPHLSFTTHWFLLRVELLWALNEGTLHSSFLLYLFPQAEEEVQMGSSLFHASCGRPVRRLQAALVRYICF